MKAIVTEAHELGTRVRSLPNTTSRILGLVFEGSMIEIVRVTPRWVQIDFGADNIEGWVFANSIKYEPLNPEKPDVVAETSESVKGLYLDFPPEFRQTPEKRKEMVSFLRWLANLLENYDYEQGD